MKKKLIWILKMSVYYSSLGLLIQAILVNALFAISPTIGQNLRYLKINVNAANVTFEEALNIIEEKTTFRFSYIDDEIPLSQKVTIKGNEESLYEILERFANDCGLVFERVNDQIVIKKAANIDIQEGRTTLQGIVVDSLAREPLVGANVFLVGTGFGAATDINGNYRIPQIPFGKYILRVSYIGYVSQDIEVSFFSEKTYDIFVQLKPAEVLGKEVIVTAQMRGQAAAINQQVTSNTAINVVSADRIKELPDANAAESVGRLPGISLIRSAGEASKVVVRGLEPKFNSITVNGVKVPSTDNDDRSVDLSMIASEMLEGIEVYKAITPDMDAEAIGGVVNLKVKKAPEEREIRLKINPGYGQLRNNWNDLKGSGSYSDRFLDNALGIVAIGNYEKINRSSENFSGGYTVKGLRDSITGIVPIAGTGLSIRNTDESRKRWGASLTLDYSFENGTIWLTNFYSSTLRNPFSVQKSYSSPNISYTLDDREVTTNGLSSSLNGEIHFLGMDLDWVVSRYKVEDKQDYNLGMSLLQGSAFDKTIFDPDILSTYMPASIDNIPATLLTAVSFSPSNTSQTDYTTQFNLKMPVRLGDFVSGSIKIGGKYTNSQKSYTVSRVVEDHYALHVMYTNGAQALVPYPLILNSNSIITAENFVSSFTDYTNILDNKYKMFPIFDRGVVNRFYGYIKPMLGYNADQLADRYKLKETIGSGYLMAELKVGQLMTVIPGVRYEGTDSWYQAYKTGTYSDAAGDPSASMDTTRARKLDYWFPHLHIKVKPAEWFNLMVSANKSIARPNYSWVSPWVRLNIANATINRGNPELKDTKVWNINVTANMFNNLLGLFSVSGFYKDLRDISYRKRTQVYKEEDIAYLQIPAKEKGYVMTTYVNSKQAKVRGFELELQTKLLFIPFIPDFLRGIIFNANYTRIWSETYFPFYNFTAIAIPGTRPPKFTLDLKEWERRGPMPGQADQIANFSVGYDVGGLSTRLSLLYQGPSISGVGEIAESDSWNNSFWRWDASIKYRFSPMVSLNFNLVNIANQPDRAYYGSEQYMTNEAFYGMTGNAGIEIAF